MSTERDVILHNTDLVRRIEAATKQIEAKPMSAWTVSEMAIYELLTDQRDPDVRVECGQPDRDRETLHKFAEKYAVMALCNLPQDYDSRKRIIAGAIAAALSDPRAAL